MVEGMLAEPWFCVAIRRRACASSYNFCPVLRTLQRCSSISGHRYLRGLEEPGEFFSDSLSDRRMWSYTLRPIPVTRPSTMAIGMKSTSATLLLPSLA